MEGERVEAKRPCNEELTEELARMSIGATESACHVEMKGQRVQAKLPCDVEFTEDLERMDMGTAERRGEPMESVRVQPLRGERVHLKGDVTIIDALMFLYRFLLSVLRLDVDDLLHQLLELQHEGHWEFRTVCRGEVVYFISSESWDEDVAFEISRNGTSLGVAQVPSRMIAVVTKKLLDLLLKENGEEGNKLTGGVSVQGVDGQLIRSGDGDFIVTRSGATAHVRKVSGWIEDECILDADILCATGGRWTFCDDSSDEEDEDSETDVDDEFQFSSRFEVS